MTETLTPIMDWDSDEPWATGIVWWNRLDKRYQIEVQRQPEPTFGPEGVDIADEAYTGTLCIFDHNDADKLVHSEQVSIAFGGPFGPDAADVDQWGRRAIEVVDNLPKQ